MFFSVSIYKKGYRICKMPLYSLWRLCCRPQWSFISTCCFPSLSSTNGNIIVAMKLNIFKKKW